MVTQKINAIILLLLSISAANGDHDYNSAFTKEIKLNKDNYPVKINNELKLFDYNLLVSTKPGHDNCQLSPFHVYLKSHHTLGNGKLLTADETVTDFTVLDFKNCSSYVSTLISNGTKNYDFDPLRHEKLLGAIVTYNDTFDVFDWYQKTCMPCRYNDKGERLEVEFPLEKEPTGEDPRWAHQHSGYSLELIKDAFAVKNGYFYVFRYVNGTTALRILDSKFKTVKQRLFPNTIEVYSLLNENLTVCYKHDSCRQYLNCEYVECHLLNSNLDSDKKVTLHQAGTDDDKYVHVQWKVKNLVGGGAMVAMQFQFGRSEPVHHKDIFIQRIHPDGEVDSPIKFDAVDNDFVFMYDFTFDNGEYCLVTVNDYYGKGSYTLIKCLNP